MQHLDSKIEKGSQGGYEEIPLINFDDNEVIVDGRNNRNEAEDWNIENDE